MARGRPDHQGPRGARVRGRCWCPCNPMHLSERAELNTRVCGGYLPSVMTLSGSYRRLGRGGGVTTGCLRGSPWSSGDRLEPAGPHSTMHALHRRQQRVRSFSCKEVLEIPEQTREIAGSCEGSLAAGLSPPEPATVSTQKSRPRGPGLLRCLAGRLTQLRRMQCPCAAEAPRKGRRRRTDHQPYPCYR